MISDYELSCIIGILPEERITPQRLLISFELYCAPSLPLADNDLSGSISYAEAVSLLANLAMTTKAGTLEYLANLCLNTLFEHYGKQLKHVVITLKKPDIISEAAFAGIKVSRSCPFFDGATHG